MDMGALGIKVRCGGRLGGAELARTEQYKDGKTPLHTLRANIDYGFAEARTMAGKIGVKTWICLPDHMEEDQNAPDSQNGSQRKITGSTVYSTPVGMNTNSVSRTRLYTLIKW